MGGFFVEQLSLLYVVDTTALNAPVEKMQALCVFNDGHPASHFHHGP
jgi:hypothetical protein